MAEAGVTSIASARTRVPPHNLEAERAVLGAPLIKPSVLFEVLTLLTVDDFFLPAHREVFDAMGAVNARGMKLDALTLADELKARGMLPRLEGGESYLLTLVNTVPTAENVGHYIRLVREHATARQLIAACAESMSRLYGGSATTDEIANDLRAEIAKVEARSAKRGPVRIGDRLDEVVDAIGDRRRAPDSYVITTGIETFDARFRVFYPAKLVYIAARPGQGKSSFIKNVLVHAAINQIPSLVFSPEMLFDEIAERILSSQARVAGDRISAGAIDDAEMSRIVGAHRVLRGIPLWIDDQTTAWDHILAEARIWRADRRRERARLPDSDPRKNDDRAIIAVDYLQLAKGRQKAENQNLRIAEMSQSAKALAKELRLPVALLSQLGREVEREDRKPRPSDLRDSGSLEQDADAIIFPWRKTITEDDPSEPQYSELIVGKNRGGATGSVSVLYEREFTSFRDPRDTDPGPPHWQEDAND